MNPSELKPILSAIVLPPAGPLLLAFAGLALLAARRRLGLVLAVAGTGALWLLSCHGVAVWLSARVLPPVSPAPPAAWPAVQAVVVLGGGVLRDAPEYGQAQPSAATLGRLRYAARMARQHGKPLAFAGGVGWASIGGGLAPEAEVAQQALQQDWGLSLQWLDAQSRDTVENARQMRQLLAGIERIALVTDAWHMPRAVRAFEAVGFRVLPAPTGFAAATTRPLLQWLPSSEGLALSRQVLREWLALRAGS